MRQSFQLGACVLLAACAAACAGAQARMGMRHGYSHSGSGAGRMRSNPHSRSRGFPGYGYGFLPYNSGTTSGSDSSPAVYFVQPPAPTAEPPAPPVPAAPADLAFKEYKWPAGSSTSPAHEASIADAQPQTLALVLKDGSTLSAVTVFVAEDGVHYVDPDARHMRVAMSAIDRAATLRLNRAHNLNLYLPAAQ